MKQLITVHAATPEALRDAFIAFIGGIDQRYELEARSRPTAQRAKIIAALRAELQLISAFWSGVKIEGPPKRIRNKVKS